MTVAGATAEPCGPAGIVGLAMRGGPTADGGFGLDLVATVAPRDPLVVRPLLFVDGVLLGVDATVEGAGAAAAGTASGAESATVAGAVAGSVAGSAGGALALPCREEVRWVVGPPVAPQHAVHWTLIPAPSVPPALAATTPEEAEARYAGGDPPGLYPWADVGTHRPQGAAPWPRATRAVEPIDEGQLFDDRLHALDADGRPRDARMVRAPVGAPRPFRLHYAPGSLGGGDMVATCLLDDRQIAAFDGAAWRHASVAHGELLVLQGSVAIPRPGWHRLHCFLLPDDPGEPGHTWPRPLLALYVWGDP